MKYVKRIDKGSWVEQCREIVVEIREGEVDHERLGMKL